MQKSFEIDQEFMENIGKYNNKHTSNSILSLEDYHYDIFEYVNTLFESLLSQNIENQQITFMK